MKGPVAVPPQYRDVEDGRNFVFLSNFGIQSGPINGCLS